MLAPCQFVAGVVSADVLVVAIEELQAHALPSPALVCTAARTAVIARFGIVDIDTACHRVAAIIGAEVAIIAIGSRSANALPRDTNIAEGADIGVLTEHAIGAGCEPTLAGIGLTNCHQARAVGTIRVRTFDYRIGVDDTLVGQLLHVADQSAVAKVAIFQGIAVSVDLAATVH